MEFVAADMPHANKMALQVLAVFAEYERDQISERTRRALAQAKERGTKLGGPKRLEASALGAAANKGNAERFAANTLPIIREIQASGVTSLRGVARALMHGTPARVLAQHLGRNLRFVRASWGVTRNLTTPNIA